MIDKKDIYVMSEKEFDLVNDSPEGVSSCGCGCIIAIVFVIGMLFLFGADLLIFFSATGGPLWTILIIILLVARRIFGR